MTEESKARPWSQTGFTGLDDAEKRQKEKGSKYLRLWLEVKAEKRLVFLDDVPFCIYEHQLKIDGKWGNHFTCANGIHRCVPCDKQDSPQYIGYFTVIDTTGYTDSKGVTHKNNKKLYGAKVAALRALERIKEKRGSLVGAAIDVFRSSKQAANCGDQFDYIEVVDLKRFEDTEPFDYMTLFAPKKPEDVDQIIGSASVDEDADDSGKSVPF